MMGWPEKKDFVECTHVEDLRGKGRGAPTAILRTTVAG